MTIFDVLRHWWIRWRRSTTFGRSLLTTVIVVLAVAYFGGWFAVLGWFYPDVMAEVAPTRDPLRLLNEHLLSGAAGLVVARFFLQRVDPGAWRTLLCLPVRRTTLARAIQIASAASLLTLLPLLGLAALVASTVLPGTSPFEAVLWTAGVLLAVGITHFAHVWLRVAWLRRRWSIVLGVSAVVLGLVGGDLLGGTVVRDASAWLFGGTQRGHVGPLLVLAVGAVALGTASTTALRRYMYKEAGGATKRQGERAEGNDVGTCRWMLGGEEGSGRLFSWKGPLFFGIVGPASSFSLGVACLYFLSIWS